MAAGSPYRPASAAGGGSYAESPARVLGSPTRGGVSAFSPSGYPAFSASVTMKTLTGSPSLGGPRSPAAGRGSPGGGSTAAGTSQILRSGLRPEEEALVRKAARAEGAAAQLRLKLDAEIERANNAERRTREAVADASRARLEQKSEAVLRATAEDSARRAEAAREEAIHAASRFKEALRRAEAAREEALALASESEARRNAAESEMRACIDALRVSEAERQAVLAAHAKAELSRQRAEERAAALEEENARLVAAVVEARRETEGCRAEERRLTKLLREAQLAGAMS